MATPTYSGNAQPTANSGWLGGLGSWFGVKAPAYVGAGQQVAASSGYFSGNAPAYKTASAKTSDDSQPDRITLVVPRSLVPPELLDQQQ